MKLASLRVLTTFPLSVIFLCSCATSERTSRRHPDKTDLAIEAAGAQFGLTGMLTAEAIKAVHHHNQEKRERDLMYGEGSKSEYLNPAPSAQQPGAMATRSSGGTEYLAQ